MKVTYFYATPDDLRGVLTAVESIAALGYAVHPDRSAARVETYDRATDIPDLLSLFPGYFVQELYLLPPGTAVAAVPFEHVTGIRYRLTPREVSSAVIMQLGGEHPDGALIRSRFWQHGSDAMVQRIGRTLRQQMRRDFQDVGEAKVGRQAMAQLREGRRLTFDAKAPPEGYLRAG
ncbi:hypothetical protein BOO69_12965 [Sulfitobacter alexandrii]|uniref:Uncharacterized protein n=1 Tax=Sulfitobacter alexandrii TaxID=1917485 RepID=A0A1J0WIQ0_9RHOB|nr:hypothetical protein [Sulfitobacter alexandrii]APE44207.1 hypothetical protein BOO69_12965 [Sulfitobacter alexandrii]